MNITCAGDYLVRAFCCDLKLRKIVVTTDLFYGSQDSHGMF